MENIDINNKKPIGSLFNSINYYSIDDLESFISSINHEQALYCIVQAVQAAYQRNTFTIAEAEVVSKSIRKISKPKFTDNTTTEEDN